MFAWTDSSLYWPCVSALIVILHVGQFKEPGQKIKPFYVAGAKQFAKNDRLSAWNNSASLWNDFDQILCLWLLLKFHGHIPSMVKILIKKKLFTWRPKVHSLRFAVYWLSTKKIWHSQREPGETHDSLSYIIHCFNDEVIEWVPAWLPRQILLPCCVSSEQKRTLGKETDFTIEAERAVSEVDCVWNVMAHCQWGRLRLKCDGKRAETRFRLSAKRTSPFKSPWGVSSVDYWQPRCAHQR